MGRKKKNEGKDALDVLLKLHGVDVVKIFADLLKDDNVSARVKADLVKDALTYQYAKQKAVAVDIDTGSGVTFNLNMTGEG